ncbi:DNA repair protein RecN [Actinobacteria bacterium YIM 96077]|uniref:DNA repair protein RecN n=1 Tax=Phytoactinopolyspora halophila TaxID=1981511 RepID=A0A329QE60_9ACTN|nr:DNA repair protein RecN [Phytoactinopolyspora halophila]AYY13619.1 DNA repair protein RecN [Actinobacteria bacterium YIM 96077]RAW10715.1 DNA repair protein RecN [Phytoactinopolyspora halophila]
MLHEIRIRGLGVIDDAQLELGPGLTVVTGETGAGKTMVLTGLNLLMGGRADGGAVRAGADRAVVEGRLQVEPESPAVVRAVEAGAELDDGELLMSRTLSAGGRSRAHVGGRGAPVGLLAELAEELVAVHGQSDQQRLLRSSRQRLALDRFAGADVAEPLAEYGHRYERLRAVEAELTEVTTRARERAQEADMLRFGLGEIERVDPQPGEDVALAAEEERLGHADALRNAAETAHRALSADETGPGEADVLTLLGSARQALEPEAGHDPELSALTDRLAEATYLLGDIAADLASYANNIDTDPVRLAEVQERRAALADLIRKYGDGGPGAGRGEPSGGPAGASGEPAEASGEPGETEAGRSEIDAVLAWAEHGSRRLFELDGDDERVATLRAERDQLTAELTELAGTITRARTDAAEKFSSAVGDELTALAMPHARVQVEVRPRGELGPQGADDVEILFSAHTGAQPRPLDKGASGGELSRLMLAIEVVFAGADPVPTFVFDEVDAGVGGKAAVEVGRRLAALARHAQVLVVTHLPQVAAFADRHLTVVKSDDGSVTSSDVQTLDDTGRVRELSRMLAGQEDSASAQAHAEELLSAAAAERMRSRA